jgi:hypothetical protein
MMADTGLVQSVYVRDHGSALAADAAVGDTVLSLEFVADFDEDGGTLSLNGDEYGYIAVDKEADTVTLGSAVTTAASASDMVTVVNSTGSPASTWFAEVLLDDPDDSDPVDCEIGTALVDKYDEGVYDPPVPVVVTAESGSWEVLTSPGQVLANSSRDYTPGEAGWVLGDDDAQLPNTNVVGSLGADNLSSDTFTLGGQDLQADIISGLPLGAIAYAFADSVTATGTTTATTEMVFFRFNVGSLYAGRQYRFTYFGLVASTPAVAGDVYEVLCRYTTDGTTPTVTSPVMPRSAYRISYPIDSNVSFGKTFLFSLNADADNVRIAFTGQRAVGTGSLGINNNDPNHTFYMACEDMGLTANVGGTMAQVSKATGTADPEPTATYTKRFNATSSRSYDGDGGYRTGDPATHDCFQGYYSGTHGNTKSIVCFDDAAIRSTLAGASIQSVKLKFRVKHSYYNAGLNVHVKTHNFSSAPATYSAGGEIAARSGCMEGSTYSVTLPLSFATDLKNGNARGVSFYGPSTNRAYYGYLYGPTSNSVPQLIITYTK